MRKCVPGHRQVKDSLFILQLDPPSKKDKLTTNETVFSIHLVFVSVSLCHCVSFSPSLIGNFSSLLGHFAFCN